MSLPSEVQKTIHALDKKIAALEETKRRLIETFGEAVSVRAVEAPNGNGNAHKAGLSATPVHPVPLPSENPIILSSADKLAAFLRVHGPATRKEISELSQVPGGSISYLLKTDRFRQREDQKWEVMA
jgi:hypothetical protein